MYHFGTLRHTGYGVITTMEMVLIMPKTSSVWYPIPYILWYVVVHTMHMVGIRVSYTLSNAGVLVVLPVLCRHYEVVKGHTVLY
jgi:hypothetical protein